LSIRRLRTASKTSQRIGRIVRRPYGVTPLSGRSREADLPSGTGRDNALPSAWSCEHVRPNARSLVDVPSSLSDPDDALPSLSDPDDALPSLSGLDDDHQDATHSDDKINLMMRHADDHAALDDDEIETTNLREAVPG
jgi:hypothetical protein